MGLPQNTYLTLVLMRHDELQNADPTCYGCLGYVQARARAESTRQKGHSYLCQMWSNADFLGAHDYCTRALHVPFTLELIMTHTRLHQLSFVIETVCLSEINDQTHLQLPGSHQIYQHAEFKAVSLRYL